jgi:hypothetical protein
MNTRVLVDGDVLFEIGQSPFRKRYCLHQTCNTVMTEGMLLQGRSYCSKKCQRAAAAIRRKVERHADIVKELRQELREALADARAARKVSMAATKQLRNFLLTCTCGATVKDPSQT